MADKCLTCGKKLSPSTSPREKMYCNSTCRSKRWYHEHLDGGKKVVKKKKMSKKKEVEELSIHFASPTKEAFDGKELNRITLDEPAMWVTKKEDVPPPMPVRMKGEDAIDFAARKNEFKRLYGSK